MVTLALNVADPIVAGEYGNAAFDAVGPLLLIGWAEVGSGFLQAIGTTTPQTHTSDAEQGFRRPEQTVGPHKAGRRSAPRGAPEADLRRRRASDWGSAPNGHVGWLLSCVAKPRRTPLATRPKTRSDPRTAARP